MGRRGGWIRVAIKTRAQPLLWQCSSLRRGQAPELLWTNDECRNETGSRWYHHKSHKNRTRSLYTRIGVEGEGDTLCWKIPDCDPKNSQHSRSFQPNWGRILLRLALFVWRVTIPWYHKTAIEIMTLASPLAVVSQRIPIVGKFHILIQKLPSSISGLNVRTTAICMQRELNGSEFMIIIRIKLCVTVTECKNSSQ